MSSALTIYKLIILYMLDNTEGPILKYRISGFLLENGYTNFINLAETYEEIEKSGLIEEKISGEKIFLKITEEGKESLHYFSADLGDSIKGQIREFLKKNGERLRNDREMVAEYFKMEAGGYEAHVGVYEKNTPVVSITLSVPDKKTAEDIVRSWKEKSQEIYGYLIEKLF